METSPAPVDPDSMVPPTEEDTAEVAEQPYDSISEYAPEAVEEVADEIAETAPTKAENA